MKFIKLYEDFEHLFEVDPTQGELDFPEDSPEDSQEDKNRYVVLRVYGKKKFGNKRDITGGKVLAYFDTLAELAVSEYTVYNTFVKSNKGLKEKFPEAFDDTSIEEKAIEYTLEFLNDRFNRFGSIPFLSLVGVPEEEIPMLLVDTFDSSEKPIAHFLLDTKVTPRYGDNSEVMGYLKKIKRNSIGELLGEVIKIDIKVGDTVLGGRFKNKKIVVKKIGKNKKGDVTINGKPLLKFRIIKESEGDSLMELGMDAFQLMELLVFTYGKETFPDSFQMVMDYDDDYDCDECYFHIEQDLRNANLYDDFMEKWEEYGITKDEHDPFHWRHRRKQEEDLLGGLD